MYHERDCVAARVIVACRLLESELCGPERGAEFCDEFLCSVGVAAETAGQVTVQALALAGPMGVPSHVTAPGTAMAPGHGKRHVTLATSATWDRQ